MKRNTTKNTHAGGQVNLISRFRNYFLLGICAVLAIFSVVMTIEVSATGAQIAGLQTKEISLSAQKRLLEGQLVKTSSLNELQSKSAELGFTKPEQMVYLSPGAAVANIP